MMGGSAFVDGACLHYDTVQASDQRRSNGLHMHKPCNIDYI